MPKITVSPSNFIILWLITLAEGDTFDLTHYGDSANITLPEMFVINATHLCALFKNMGGDTTIKSSTVKNPRWFYSGISSCKGSFCNLV